MTSEELEAYKKQELHDKLKKVRKKLDIRVPAGNVVYQWEAATGNITREPTFKKGNRVFTVVNRKEYLYIHAINDKEAVRKFTTLLNGLEEKIKKEDGKTHAEGEDNARHPGARE